MPALLLWILSAACFADSITLIDGTVLNGTVLSASGGRMVVQLGEGSRTLDISDVRFVLFSGAPGAPPPAKPKPVEPKPPIEWLKGRLIHSLGWRLVTTRTSPGLFFETGYLVPFRSAVEAGPTIGYGVFDAKPGRLSKGKLRLLPFSVMARVKPPKGRPLHFDFGLGYTLIDYSADNSAIEAKAAEGLSWHEEVSDSLGGFIGVGVERVLVGNVETGMTLRWTYLRPMSKVERGSLAGGASIAEEERANLSGFSFVGSLGIRF